MRRNPYSMKRIATYFLCLYAFYEIDRLNYLMALYSFMSKGIASSFSCIINWYAPSLCFIERLVMFDQLNSEDYPTENIVKSFIFLNFLSFTRNILISQELILYNIGINKVCVIVFPTFKKIDCPSVKPHLQRTLCALLHISISCKQVNLTDWEDDIKLLKLWSSLSFI